jgi:hypothetical protein
LNYREKITLSVSLVNNPGYVLYGQPGCKKTFVVLDIAMTVGALTADEVGHGVTLDWHGRKVEHGSEHYVWAEGQGGIRKRITAWRQMRQRLGKGHSIAVRDKAFNLRDQREVADLIGAAGEVVQATGLPLKLIVIDTVSRCSGNANINAPGEMAELVSGLERLKSETGAVILIIHHEGKDESRGMMGATTLKGAVDAEMKVKAEGNTVTVEGGKTKDDAPAEMSFRTRVVDVVDPRTRDPLLTKNGKRVTTLVIESPDPGEMPERGQRPKLSDPQANALQAFHDWLIDHDTPSMPLEQWTPCLTGRGIVDDRKRAKEVRDALDRKGLVRIEQGEIHVGRKV